MPKAPRSTISHQFPIYDKLWQVHKGGKELVAEIIQAETGLFPTRFAMNMWRSRGAIPPKYVLLILEYCASKGIKADRSDFKAAQHCDTLKMESSKPSSPI